MEKAGLKARGFNFGIDGFSSELGLTVIRYFDLKSRAPDLRIVVIGVQLIEEHRLEPIEKYGELGCDGALQRPIFQSAMARDLGFAHLCKKSSWKGNLVGIIEDVSNVIRYRRALRSFLVGWSEGYGNVIDFNSTALEHLANGFQPNKPIRLARTNYEHGLASKRRELAENPRLKGPLSIETWPKLTSKGGTFDRWAERFLKVGVLPVFVALPTNPLLIDLKKRRDDYARNSRLLTEWQERRGDIVFIDLGILDWLEPEEDYSDFRHLSVNGALKFSSKLGKAMAQNDLVRKSLQAAK